MGEFFPAMLKASSSIASRKWPFFAAFILGYTLGYGFGGSTLGGAVGGGIGAVCYIIWNAFKNREELLALYRNHKRDYHPGAVPVGDRQPNTAIVWIALGYVVALFGYNLLIAGWHDTSLLANLIEAVKPSADWMAQFVPALERIPRAMIQKGYGDWAPVVQHVLFVDWIPTIAMMVVILFDFAFLRGRAFGLAVPVSRWRQLKVAVVSATVVAVAFLFLFFGWFPRSGDLVGIFGSLLIAGLLVSTVFFWAGLVVFCNGFVRGREISNVNEDAVEAQRKTQELLKRLLGGNV